MDEICGILQIETSEQNYKTLLIDLPLYMWRCIHTRGMQECNLVWFHYHLILGLDSETPVYTDKGDKTTSWAHRMSLYLHNISILSYLTMSKNNIQTSFNVLVLIFLSTV